MSSIQIFGAGHNIAAAEGNINGVDLSRRTEATQSVGDYISGFLSIRFTTTSIAKNGKLLLTAMGKTDMISAFMAMVSYEAKRSFIEQVLFEYVGGLSNYHRTKKFRTLNRDFTRLRKQAQRAHSHSNYSTNLMNERGRRGGRYDGYTSGGRGKENTIRGDAGTGGYGGDRCGHSRGGYGGGKSGANTPLSDAYRHEQYFHRDVGGGALNKRRNNYSTNCPSNQSSHSSHGNRFNYSNQSNGQDNGKLNARDLTPPDTGTYRSRSPSRSRSRSRDRSDRSDNSRSRSRDNRRTRQRIGGTAHQSYDYNNTSPTNNNNNDYYKSPLTHSINNNNCVQYLQRCNGTFISPNANPLTITNMLNRNKDDEADAFTAGDDALFGSNMVKIISVNWTTNIPYATIRMQQANGQQSQHHVPLMDLSRINKNNNNTNITATAPKDYNSYRVSVNSKNNVTADRPANVKNNSDKNNNVCEKGDLFKTELCENWVKKDRCVRGIQRKQTPPKPITRDNVSSQIDIGDIGDIGAHLPPLCEQLKNYINELEGEKTKISKEEEKRRLNVLMEIWQTHYSCI